VAGDDLSRVEESLRDLQMLADRLQQISAYLPALDD
jgi:hypothetical protein